MGEWGYENFESDEALNTLAALLKDRVEIIRRTFTYQSNETLYETQGDSNIIANVDILSTLCETYNVWPDLEPSEISKWKADYLSEYDRLYDAYDKSPEDIEFLANRRKVVEATFERFYLIIATLWRDIFLDKE